MFNPSVEKIIGSIKAKGVCFTYADDLESAALKARNTGGPNDLEMVSNFNNHLIDTCLKIGLFKP